MTLSPLYTELIEDIQHNCNISDARDHGIYSMCTMVLKLRNLYKWEKGLQPWEEPESADLLDWIDAKEKFWATIANEPYRPLSAFGGTIAPLDLEEVNATLNGTLFYGAGYGRSMKAVFFLAEKREQRIVEGCPVTILGLEQAREMASPFAMVQEGQIIIRSQSLRYFFWDQVQEVRSSCRSSLRYALDDYGVLRDGVLDQNLFRDTLDRIVEEEMNLFVYHEVGEMLQSTLTSESLKTIIGHFPGSVLEFVGRAVKDILADIHPQGLLAYVIREERISSLAFYLAFMDGLRAKLFPEIQAAWQLFLVDRDWHHIEQARSSCWQKNQEIAEQIALAAERIGKDPDEKIVEHFNSEILVPLGLDTLLSKGQE
ncbi:Sfum_1244 family protein [Desulfopila aestuarii]|uniref:Uncharacterized protein n=1 Tax=Desulfopila aestuarii DSM 18488 TaxID=1121416 RepID=A0A1M7Y9K4_9BACT|nr:Sfum_1244 family protein [Desulfopila aestuarii]SHO49261.1 hypothetical protein SAMN02745220_02764 [Desulfopila aestuarii DSM 18488]